MVISAKTYEQVALEDPDGFWELAHGVLRRKPPMTNAHDWAMVSLTRQLILQTDLQLYVVFSNSARLRIPSGAYYIPDLCVVPRTEVRRALAERPRQLDVYEMPIPLVVEVWSPSTGEYDVEVKLREYQQRGDAEIWRIHPYERTLTSWRREPDGTYQATVYQEGAVSPVALPGVVIQLDELFG